MRILSWLPLPMLVLVLGLAACPAPPQTEADGGVDASAGIDAAGCSPACGANATCGGTTCTCNNGYTGDGLTCTDINECLTNNGGCDVNAVCTNVSGSRTCACRAGFNGDGLTCSPIWTQVGTLPGANLDPERFGAIATALDTRIYFGPRANTATNRFMRSFDVMTGTFAGPHALPPGSQTDFCACGYTSAMLSDGAQIFLLGNDGYRYTPANNTWTQIPSYADPYRRGEAAGTYDAINKVFLLVGGRSNGTTAIRMVLPGLSFSFEGGTLPIAMDSARAYTPPGGSLTYIAGGDNNSGLGLLSHVTGTTQWTRLADAPANLGRPTGMGGVNGKVWVATRQRLYLYNPVTSAWDPSVIDGPPGFILAVNASGELGTYAFAQNGANIEVFRLSLP